MKEDSTTSTTPCLAPRHGQEEHWARQPSFTGGEEDITTHQDQDAAVWGPLDVADEIMILQHIGGR